MTERSEASEAGAATEATEATEPSRCPKCAAKLWHVERAGMVLETCSACEGMWFDAGELHRLVGVVPAFEAGAGAPSGVACVACGAGLREVTFPRTSVRIDRCPACQGVWLDRRELEALKEQLADLVPADDPLWVTRAQAGIDAVEAAARERGRCRSCDGRLTSRRRGPVFVDACNACGGTWFDAGELTAVLGISRPLSLKGAPQGELRCFRCPCARLLDASYPRTEVPMAVCPDCRGTWLDGPSLTALGRELGVPIA